MKNNEILRTYGKNYKEMTMSLLEEADLKSLIDAKGTDRPRIGIKPNLVSPTPADYGATTHPEVVEGIVEYLQKNGFDRIVIMEGSWIGDTTEDAFEYCGYNSLAAAYGIELIDMQKEKGVEVDAGDMTLKVCKCAKDVDFLINVPVLKGHCQTKITCALKNMKGLIPNSEKRRFHTMGLHDPIAHLNFYIRQDFIVVDHICGDLDFEGGGNPYVSDCVMAAVDPVLTDAYVCDLLGYKTEDVKYIVEAAELGVGSMDLNGLELKTVGEDDHEEVLPHIHRVLELGYVAEDIDTCSACYEGLMEALDMMDKENLLEMFKSKICIGQGYRGKTGDFGVGNCTRLFKHTVAGCPPKAEDIFEAMKKWVETDNE
ncbi:MAG: DUF362 domain-containing protein [Lachnospiraceae bacterium]|nr:DUF362 domain-containing protein [Lachnospiraceae bacterium]